MSELAKAYVQIIPSARGIKDTLGKELGANMPESGKSAGNVFGSNLISTVKNMIVAAGIGKALSATLMAGADLQQSLGGVETLFKENAATVIANAVVKGTERFALLDHETSYPNRAYKPDIIGYTYDASKAMFIDSTPERFFLFFPSDWHIAKIQTDKQDQNIRVVVIKLDYVK